MMDWRGIVPALCFELFDMRAELSEPVSSYSGRLPGLDGLRAISVLLVFLAHASMNWGLTYPVAQFVTYHGGVLGVLCFFVISGYLITTLLMREYQRTGKIQLGAYYQRRILRIFPAFYVYVAVMACLTWAGVLQISGRELLTGAGHVWNYGGLWLQNPSIDGQWYLGHLWTLSLEEQFYLVWPAAMVLAGPLRAGKVALAVCCLMPVIRLATYFWFPAQRGMMTSMMLHTGADGIMIGCLAALMESRGWFQSGLAGLMSLRLGAFLPIMVLACSAVCHYFLKGAWGLAAGRTVDAVCLCILILMVLRTPQTLVGRILNSRVLCHFGVLSYSLYLWQQPFTGVLNTTWSGSFPLNLLCSYGMALLSYHLVERPFLRWKDALSSRQRQTERIEARLEMHIETSRGSLSAHRDASSVSMARRGATSRTLLVSLAVLVGLGLGLSGEVARRVHEWQEERRGHAPWPAESNPVIPANEEGRLALFILMGQSNMSGRGPLTEASRQTSPGVYVFGNDGRWHHGREPVDNGFEQIDLVSRDVVVGVSPGMAFARRFKELSPGRPIGLVPCAMGGSSISEWSHRLSDNTLYGS